MTADLLADWWQHTVTVERLIGTSAYGDKFAAGETLAGFVDDSNKLIINGQGQQVVSSARVFLPPATADIPLKSRVTLSGPFLGRQSTVIAVSRHDAGVLPTPNHLEVSLQ